MLESPLALSLTGSNASLSGKVPDDKESRLLAAQNAILCDISLAASGMSPLPIEAPPTAPKLSVAMGAFVMQSMAVSPLDTLRLRGTIWQMPYRSLLLDPQSHLLNAKIIAQSWSCLGASTALTVSTRACKWYLWKRNPKNALFRASLNSAIDFATFPLRHVFLHRQVRPLAFPMPSVREYANFCRRPWASHMFSPRISDGASFLAHRFLEWAEYATAALLRENLPNLRSPRYRPEKSSEDNQDPLRSPHSVLPPYLFERLVSRLIAKVIVHIPRTALLRYELDLPSVPIFRLFAGVEHAVLAELLIDWLVIDLSAIAMDWITPSSSP